MSSNKKRLIWLWKQGYSVADAAQVVGITPALLYKWKAKLTEEPTLNHDEKAELLRLRKEIKQLRMEQEILKKASVEGFIALRVLS